MPRIDPETALSPPNGTELGDWATREVEALRKALSEWGRRAFDNYAELAQDAPSEAGRTFWRERATLILEEPPF